MERRTVCSIDYGTKRREKENYSVYIQRVFGYIFRYASASIAASSLSPPETRYSTPTGFNPMFIILSAGMEFGPADSLASEGLQPPSAQGCGHEAGD
jgi:hypothetical protein